MSPQRFVLLVLGMVGVSTVFTFFSLLRAHPQRDLATEAEQDSSNSGIRALFSFHTPSTLFPPSAIISLTDDNSTFFLARPADFGPALVSTGLSGQLWIGHGFGEGGSGRAGADTGAEGELGCSDVPGWEEGSQLHRKDEDLQNKEVDLKRIQATADEQTDLDSAATDYQPTEDDGTDDHLHHPLPSSSVAKMTGPGQPAEHEEVREGLPATHGDIQSLQESAEIAGRVVLLSRGGCGFLEKVKWAQRRGATALIVGDHTRGGALVTMYARGDTSNVSIPSLFTSHTTAHLLSTLIPAEEPNQGYWRGRKRPLSSSGSDGKDWSNRSPRTSGQTDDRPTFTRAASPRATSTNPRASSKNSRVRSSDSLSKPSQNVKRSWFGLGKHSEDAEGKSDSTRPPSSGQHDWFGSTWAGKRKRPSQKESAQTGSSSKNSWWPTSPSQSDNDFVIGVQDWRDPDLVVAEGTSVKTTVTSTSALPWSSATPSVKSGKDDDAEKGVASPFSGGSITPSSGEYDQGRKSGVSDQDRKSGVREDGISSVTSENKINEATQDRLRQGGGDRPSEEHDGLWVTLTPTTMSTSPFFDTLLVLVVSPLVTLTVVYALLLLRSRIRRRRWRAPKSVVDQLPVHTYQTMASISSTTSSTRYASPQASSPTSPLLLSEPRTSARSRPRSATATGIGEAVSESLERAATKAAIMGSSGNASLKKAYRGRQVECVVCLEEYVDGKSKVMSLPCGHEFHAECITPWLTTRRRTCPICKGDVVRSMTHPSPKAHASPQPTGLSSFADVQTQAAQTTNDSPSAAIPIPAPIDLERGEDMAATLVNDQPESSYAPRAGWRGFASMSLSAFSGRAERSERKEDDRDR